MHGLNVDVEVRAAVQYLLHPTYTLNLFLSLEYSGFRHFLSWSLVLFLGLVGGWGHDFLREQVESLPIPPGFALCHLQTPSLVGRVMACATVGVGALNFK